jgi:hypothetical protein
LQGLSCSSDFPPVVVTLLPQMYFGAFKGIWKM